MLCKRSADWGTETHTKARIPPHAPSDYVPISARKEPATYPTADICRNGPRTEHSAANVLRLLIDDRICAAGGTHLAIGRPLRPRLRGDYAETTR